MVLLSFNIVILFIAASSLAFPFRYLEYQAEKRSQEVAYAPRALQRVGTRVCQDYSDLAIRDTLTDELDDRPNDGHFEFSWRCDDTKPLDRQLDEFLEIRDLFDGILEMRDLDGLPLVKKSIFSKIKDGFKKVGKGVKKVVKKASHAVKSVVKKAGGAIKSAVRKIGDAVKKVAKKAGGAIKHVAGTVKKDVRKGVKVAEKGLQKALPVVEAGASAAELAFPGAALVAPAASLLEGVIIKDLSKGK